MDELPVPHSMKNAEGATEIIRAFLENDELHMSLNVGIWDDPVAWGVVLGDVARQLADAYHKTAGIDRNETIRQIGMVFITELNGSATPADGRLIDEGDTRED